jgi:hypothetical protein
MDGSGVRDWMCWYFEKNEASFNQAPNLEVNWDKRNVMAGAICLSLVRDFVICVAAGSESLGDAILGRAGILLRQAMARFGDAVDRDQIRLDRIELALAERLGAVFSPGASNEVHSVPFDAFPRYLEAPGINLEESNACRVLWALLAVLEGNQEEYEAARDAEVRVHSELRAEMKLVPTLPDLAADASCSGWSAFEEVLARWLNPVLKTTSYASNFQEPFAASMSLFWCKYHLTQLDRSTLIGTYLGEKTGIPVIVNGA